MPRISAGKTFFVIMFGAFAAVVLVFPQPLLLRDYPEWVYQGVLLAKMLAGHPVSGYALKHYPVPNTITTLALGGMTWVWGWKLAAKLWLVIYFVFAAITGLYVGSVFKVTSYLWWVLPAAFFFGQSFWFGMISFNIGMCLLLILACRLYRQREDLPSIASLLLLSFFVHLVIYVSAILMVLLYCLQVRRWRLFYLGLATSPLVLWYFVGRVREHTDESRYGYSPTSHIAVSCVAVLILLAISFFRPKWSIRRLTGKALVALSLVVLAGATASALTSSPGMSSARLLLEIKVFRPLALSGFVNVVYRSADEQIYSLTLALLHRPLFWTAVVLSTFATLALAGGIGKALIDSPAPLEGQSSTSAAGFLWDFVALYAVLYFTSPPNALGVIAIDMRLAVIALGPALYVLASEKSRALRYAAVPCALLAACSLYQFSISQGRGFPPASRMSHPELVESFGGVEPNSVESTYRSLDKLRFDRPIWSTGIMIETAPHAVVNGGAVR